MACTACERRRKEMAMMLEATRLWTMTPTGPNVHEIYTRLHDEARARGDFDDPVRPSS